ncbi:ATP-binding cassette sub-family A member 3, partial [Stegodyphus mimosarum]
MAEVNHILNILDLEVNRKVAAYSLVPSWQRKLSVGIALIGGSQVVIIDEPTKHMDSFSRRIVWDALQAEKVKRTILITSSHMKEAEALGDRIALMDEGHLQCYGTPTFLRKIYGAGYHLVIQREPSCSISNLSELVFAQIPDAKLCSDEDEITYLLPPTSSHMFHFLFYDLEDQKEQLNIGTFKITEITLEEIFDSVSLILSPGTCIKNSLMKKFVNPNEEASSNSGISNIYLT